jgi:glycogen debranching enzyme
MHYGFVKEAQQLSSALLEAAEYTDNRLPELFCGFSRSDYPEPLPYPTACSPQAWASATPVMLIRSLLRFEMHASLGGLWMDPVLPASWGDLHATNATVGEARVSLDVSGDQVTVEGLPKGMVFHRGTRPELDDLLKVEVDRPRP